MAKGKGKGKGRSSKKNTGWKSVHVKGYTKDDGTRVKGYDRKKPK